MSSTYNKERHDIGIQNVGSAGAGTDVIGRMLAKREDGVTPAYEEYDGKYLAQQFFTGTPSLVNIDPEEEVILSQDDWRSGFGLDVFDSNDSKRYRSSIGMDLRHRGQAIAGWTSTTVTKPNTITTAASISNTTFEAAANWTNGARSSTYAHGGTYSWLVGSNTEAYQDAVTWDTSWRSKLFTFSCWVYTPTTANTGRIGINDGVGTTYSSYISATVTWQWLSVSRTLNASATRLRLILATDATTDNYFDDCALGSPTTGKAVDFAEFNDKFYMASGSALSKLNAGGTGFDTIWSFPATITDLQPFQVSGTDYLFIALGTSTAYEYMTTAEVFATSTATDKTYQFFEWVHTTADTLYGNDSGNTIRSTINPLNGGTAWSIQTIVGDAANAITSLMDKSGALYISKEDMLYYLDSSGNVQNDVAPELVSEKKSTSGKNTYLWKNNIYYPCGDQGLLEIGTANTWRNPSDYCTTLPNFVGRIMAVAGDGFWLYVAVDYATKVEILACREETIDGTTSWVIHPIHELTLQGVEAMRISSVFKKRLWIASTLSTDSLYYLPLPTAYGDITGDAERTFKTGVTFEIPFLHGEFKSDNKAWVKITLTLGHTYNAGRYFTVHYKKLGDSSWTSIGNFTGSATSMVQSRYIDVTNKPFSSMMKFQFTAVTDDPNYTPIILSYEVRAIMYPAIRKLTHCVIRCAQEVVCKNGMVDKNMYDTIKATLDNARANAVWPVSIRDIDGNTKNVKFLPVPKDLQRMLITKKEKGRENERYYHCLMLEVDLA